MSLFQARDWWTATPETQEEYWCNSLLVANIDNDPEGRDKIITGSFSGVLRIYLPKQNEYHIEDLLLEQRLELPILQMAAGKFVSGSSGLALAVLHPRQLAVYTVSTEAEGSYMKLQRAYNHNLGQDGLHFTSSSMVSGPFGGAFGRDFICVQSMDGQLSFFDADHPAFTRPIPSVLVPCPMAYSAKTDSFILCSTEMVIESYRYQVLAAASSARATDATGAPVAGTGKSLKTDWAVNIGEHAVDIKIARFCKTLTAGQFDILVLGEHTLFALKPTGGIRFQHRFDYGPVCFVPYFRGDHPECGASTDNLIVAGNTNKLAIYRDTKLIWAAVTQRPPLAIEVASFAGIRGMIVTLEEGGTIRVSYLGTDPPTTSVAPSDTKELNYEEMDEEHRQLLQQVKESHSENRAEPPERVILRAQVPSTLDASMRDESAGDLAGSMPRDAATVQLTVRLFVSYTGADSVSQVNVSLSTPRCIFAQESSFVIPTLSGGRTPVIIPLTFRPNPSVIPNDLTVRVAAAYLTANGEPRTAQCVLDLPLCMVCRLVPPLKNNTFKFTLDTNKTPPPLPALFDDMFAQPGLTEDAIQRITASSANVLTFQYYNGDDATILVSKNAGRYRVQSSCLQALWMVSQDLVRRLKDLFVSESKGGESEPLVVAYQEPLPLADFFACIDEHFMCRQAVSEAEKRLNDRAHQFRLIQKRLLVRYKERNPSPLNNLDLLMHGTYNQLIDLGNEVERHQHALELAANQLSCATHLLLLLMRYRFALDDSSFAVLKAHLTPEVSDTADQGWEECVDAAMTHLLRTVLAKSAKDSASVPQPLAVPSDTTKLKKHITIVCDRLGKGAKLYKPRRGGKDVTGSAAAAAAAAAAATGGAEGDEGADD